MSGSSEAMLGFQDYALGIGVRCKNLNRYKNTDKNSALAQLHTFTVNTVYLSMHGWFQLQMKFWSGQERRKPTPELEKAS